VKPNNYLKIIKLENGENRMQHFKYSASLIFLFIFLYLLIPQNAYAYLDPGTGSYILQVLIATFLGVGFVTRLYFRKIKNFFTNRIFKNKRDNTLNKIDEE